MSFSIGDIVTPRRGKGGPWVIASFGSQPSLFGDSDIEVAIFDDGRFMAVNKLRLATGVTDSRILDWLTKAADGRKVFLPGYGWCGLDREALCGAIRKYHGERE